MFSQLTKRIQDGIEAVEHIAQSGVPATGHASSANAEHPNLPGTEHTPSLGEEGTHSGILSSPSLAESAFSSIKRSFTIPRLASPSPDPTRLRSPSKQRTIEHGLEPVKRSGSTSLEDRLRASFAIGEASIPPSPKHEPVSLTPSIQSESIPDVFMDDPAYIPLPPSPSPSHPVPLPIEPVVPRPESVDVGPLPPNPPLDLSHSDFPPQHSDEPSDQASSLFLPTDNVSSRAPTPPVNTVPSNGTYELLLSKFWKNKFNPYECFYNSSNHC
jgi:hypothetical protein